MFTRGRRADWGKWGTVVGIFVGAAGLIFTAWATYYNAEVARATLAQSKEDAEKEEKSQAARVNYWTDEKGMMHVVNRSADPVTGMLLYVAVEQADLTPDYGDPDWKFWNQVGLYAVVFGTLEPCSHVSISAKDVTAGDDTGSPSIRVPSNSTASVGLINFYDSSGVAWVRTGGQLLKKSERVEETYSTMVKEHDAESAILKTRRAIEGVASCSDPSA
ncbi:hypothetical protein ACIP4S_13575 [Streptomyces chartreusis]|uniref:hypothetical protein n=1 Tax=Streptomyces chartreusis TaxID=1969 RepID=UPI0037FFA60C